MDRSTLRALKCFLNPVTRIYQGGRAQIEPFKMVGMTLFFLGSRMPYHQMAGVFGVSEECFIRSTNYIIYRSRWVLRPLNDNVTRSLQLM